MCIQYITMIKDYKGNKPKRIRKILEEIEDRLPCCLCAEVINVKPAVARINQAI